MIHFTNINNEDQLFDAIDNYVGTPDLVESCGWDFKTGTFDFVTEMHGQVFGTFEPSKNK